MWKNYLTIAIRNLWRNKVFSSINLFGLAISMSVSLLLLMMLNDLTSYDRFHKNGKQIYRITSQAEFQNPFRVSTVASTATQLGDAIQKEYPNRAKIVRIDKSLSGEINYKEKTFFSNGLFADASFLEVFTFPLALGNIKNALKEPYSLVLKKSLAQKIFGKANPIGKIVDLKGQGNFKITGVLDDLPGKSHFDFEMLASFSTMPGLIKANKLDAYQTNWENVWTGYVYLHLNDNQKPKEFEKILAGLNKKYYNKKKNQKYSFSLQHLYNITPGPDLGNQIGPFVPPPVIYVLLGFTFIILLSSCFNYANLSTARALTRAKEVGVRKVMGAHRKHLIVQFLAEAVIFSLLAMMFSTLLVELVWIPGFYQLDFFRSSLGLDVKQDGMVYLVFLGLSLIIGIIAGISPALYLSAFTPVKVLKGLSNVNSKKKRLSVRKVLIVLQFTISLAFVLSTYVIYQQAQMVLHADYGFDNKNLIYVDLQGVNPTVFKNEIADSPQIQQVSFSSLRPTGSSNKGIKMKNPDRGIQDIALWYAVDDNFISTFGLQLLSGRNFSTNSPSQKEKYIITNEAALKKFELGNPEQAIGKTIILNKGEENLNVQIIGVIKDFNFQNLSNNIQPLLLRYLPEEFNYANIRFPQHAAPVVVDYLQKKWVNLDKKYEFKFDYYENLINQGNLVQIFQNMAAIVGVIAFLAIIIACLGLLGMVIYLTEIRTKEIGVRKVLGAEMTHLIFLLSKGFIILLLFSMIFAFPIAWIVNDLWLSAFPYRVNFGIGFFTFGLSIVGFFGLITIVPQTWKIARMNPVDVLRNE